MEAFKNDKVVSDVINYEPKEILQLQYGATKIVPGMTMTPTNVKDKPTVSFSADPDAYYTLIMNGLHRYVFLMFKQPKGKDSFPDLPTIDNKTSTGRAKHNVKKFIEKYGMASQDCLVAGNFYQAEYDDYVPTLMSQLKH